MGYSMRWYRTVEWALHQLPQRPPWKPPWNRIGTRYGQISAPMDTANGLCARAKEEGRVDALFVRDAARSRAPGGKLTPIYCVDCIGCEATRSAPKGARN